MVSEMTETAAPVSTSMGRFLPVISMVTSKGCPALLASSLKRAKSSLSEVCSTVCTALHLPLENFLGPAGTLGQVALG